MIGPKKLSTIRHELRRALSTTGEDPIRWLEARIADAERHSPASAEDGEVLRALHRFLGAPERERGTGRNKRVGVKK